MLPITGRMKRLNEEVQDVLRILYEAEHILEGLKEDDNLTEKVGGFLRKTKKNGYQFTILADDAHLAADKMRKICSGELDIDTARKKLKGAIQEIESIQEGIALMKTRYLETRDKKE